MPGGQLSCKLFWDIAEYVFKWLSEASVMGGLPGVRPTDFNYGNSNGLTCFPKMVKLSSKQIYSGFNIQGKVPQM